MTDEDAAIPAWPTPADGCKSTTFRPDNSDGMSFAEALHFATSGSLGIIAATTSDESLGILATLDTALTLHAILVVAAPNFVEEAHAQFRLISAGWRPWYAMRVIIEPTGGSLAHHRTTHAALAPGTRANNAPALQPMQRSVAVMVFLGSDLQPDKLPVPSKIPRNSPWDLAGTFDDLVVQVTGRDKKPLSPKAWEAMSQEEFLCIALGKGLQLLLPSYMKREMAMADLATPRGALATVVGTLTGGANSKNIVPQEVFVFRAASTVDG